MNLFQGRKIVNIVIPARNEEKNIFKTLKSLENQSYLPKLVVVVDDGSVDNTLHFLKKYLTRKFIIKIVERPERIGGKSLVGKPQIAETFNKGFEEACKDNYDFIMVIGADQQIESNYIEKLLTKFEKNPKLAMASGTNPRIPSNPDHARGGGRMIAARFWKWYGEKYPVSYGWESQCQFECLRLGLEVRGYSEPHYYVSRKGQGTVDFIHWGRGMRAMGYNPIIVIFRGIRFIIIQKYGVKAAVRLIAGYANSGSLDNLSKRQKETRQFLFRYQLIKFPRKFFQNLSILL